MAELNATATMGNVLSATATLSQVVQSGGSAATGDATVDQVLAGATFSNAVDIDLTGTMPNIGKEDFTPGTANQTISEGYHDGNGVVAGDADLIAENIKTGVSIFGVAGNVVPEDLSPYKAALDSANEEASADLTAGIALVDANYGDIKAAITAKGVDMVGVKPSGFDAAITSTLEKFEPYPIGMTGIDVAAWYDPENTRTTLLTENAQSDGGIVLSLGEQFKRNALLSRSGNAPVLSNALDKKTLLFTRLNDLLAGVKNFSLPITVFQVLHPTAEPDWLTTIISFKYGASAAYIAAGGTSLSKKYALRASASSVLSGKEATINTTAVVSAIIASGDQRIWVNGGNFASATVVSMSAVTDDFIIGWNTSVTRFVGHIGDTIIINGVLSDADRIRIEDYLMTKWSVASERP